MPYVYKEVEVEIDLEDFDDDDLVEELERRGRGYNTQGVDADAMRGLLEKIWIKRRSGSANFDQELDALIWGVLGRVI
jgi:hypothetical protein